MGKDGDDKGLDEHTRISVAPTPKLPGVPASGAAASAGSEEHTQSGAVQPPPVGSGVGPSSPPAGPTAAPPAPSLSESTRLAVAPPPIPKAPAVSPTSDPKSAPISTQPRQSTPPPPPVGGGDFAEHTILLADLQREAVPAARLQRLQPPGRSDIVNLERTHYLMGRLPSCDLRLYSQTASREHAQLTARAGRWYLNPVPGKVVLVNGTQVKEEVPLTHKMRLQLGGDELLFLDEGGSVAVDDTSRTVTAGHHWLFYVIAAAALAGALWLWAAR